MLGTSDIKYLHDIKSPKYPYVHTHSHLNILNRLYLKKVQIFEENDPFSRKVFL